MTSAEPIPAPGATVLVVEDEPMLLMVVAETLREAGFTVLEASDGKSAIQSLKENHLVDVLLSDVKMPGMSGYEVVEQGLAMRPQLKVMLMTGYAQDPVPPKFTAAGIPVLYKPFDFEALPGLINRTLLPQA